MDKNKNLITFEQYETFYNMTLVNKTMCNTNLVDMTTYNMTLKNIYLEQNDPVQMTLYYMT